jgi:CheY-like chemotaxis protein
MWSKKHEVAPVLIEEIRKKARLLVVDDQSFPMQTLFSRDGYHIERWAKIRNISQLTDGYFDLILLDLHGVGLSESPLRQGLGILEHIKKSNPTQLVIAYSAEPWTITNSAYFSLADEVMEKGQDYLEFKETVDDLLARRYSPGYFISKMNQELGDSAAEAPKAVPKALAAIKAQSPGRLQSYLSSVLQDEQKIDRVTTVIVAAIKVLSEASS